MQDYKKNIVKLLGRADVTESDLVPTQDAGNGDFCLPCFRLAKTERKSPVDIAKAIAASAVPGGGISKIKAVGGYVNFFVGRKDFVRECIGEFSKGLKSPETGAGKTVVIDYSSINIAKPFHMGHLPSTAIGGSLYRIFSHLGYKTVGINYLGDYGTQFGKLICVYKRAGNLDLIKKIGVKELQRLYALYGELEEKEPTVIDEARSWSLKIEQGDAEANMLFDTFKAITLEEVGRIYKLLGIAFDSYSGESFFAKRTDAVVAELREKKLLTVSDGASVVDLSAFGMPPCLVLRSDGASLYATRDIAAAVYRYETYRFDKSLYVVAYQQNLHFKQLFQVLRLMGYAWADDMEHVAFGMVGLEGENFSSRKGNVVYLADVLDKAVERTKEIMREKSSSVENFDETAKNVGIGAVVYSALSSAKIKDVTFSLEKVLSFEGETGAYLQYTHARACSVLHKAKDTSAVPDYAAVDNIEAYQLAAAVARLPQAVLEAARTREPCAVSKQLIEIAACFNKFYFAHKILDEDAGAAAARLGLTLAARNALRDGLRLILINPVEAM